MCVNPIKILNPYINQRPFSFEHGQVKGCSRRFVSAQKYISVPCGRCADCRASYYESIRQRAIVESMTSYVYFITLTYDDAHLPSLSFTSSQGVVNIYYSDISHIQDLFKRLRNVDYLQDRHFRYLAVTEYGTERFRPHHHLLLFVARKNTDDDYTPYNLESLLYKDVLRLYGKNIGTRKNPDYECYLTFVERYINGQYKSTYTLSLVTDKSEDVLHNCVVNTPQSISKCISYLISYVNKSSRYDTLIDEFLSTSAKTFDPQLLAKLSRLLKTKVYYSKHLGFGYSDNGFKVLPSLPNFIVPESVIHFTDIYNNLPDTFEQFKQEYVNSYHRYIQFKNRIENQLTYSPRDFNFGDLCNDVVDKYSLLIAYKYEKDWLHNLIPSITSNSPFVFRLLPKSHFDTAFKDSVAYKFIRKGIELGFVNKNDYLSFIDSFSDIECYKPLCRYYKRYCTDLADMERLYNILGIRDFDDYLSRVEFNFNTYQRRCLRQSVNDNAEHTDVVDLPTTQKNNTICLAVTKKIVIFAPTADTILRL